MKLFLPIELWWYICNKLVLKDVLNIYKAYPFLINKKIYDYLPLNDKKLRSKGVSSLIKICGTCKMFHLNYMANCLQWPEEEYFKSDNLTEDKYWTLKNHTLLIQARNTLDKCYNNDIKIIFRDDIVCSYHDNGFAESIRDEIISQTENTWYEYIDSQKILNICSKCGGLGHNKYNFNCLFFSNKIKIKKIMKLNHISKKKFRENYCSQL